jgi:hypothetical protein
VLPERALDVIQMPPAMHGAHEVDRGTDGGVSGDELLWKLLCRVDIGLIVGGRRHAVPLPSLQ